MGSEQLTALAETLQEEEGRELVFIDRELQIKVIQVPWHTE
jgi:hypothetical protein